MIVTSAEWAIVMLSLRVSFVAVLVSLPIAYALAWLLARRRFPGMIVLDALVHLPLVLPPVVTGWLLLIAFGRGGEIGAWLYENFGITLVFNWTGAALAAAVMALPLMVRAMRLSIEAVDRRLVGAARTLGASSWKAFLTVTLPLSIPGIAAGAMLGFARSLGEFGATITFAANIAGETRTLPLAIYTGLQTPGGEDAVTRLAIISIILSLGALVLSEWLVRRAQGGRAHVL
ncbi:molybdate ABC transporter permease subunit [Erythrobacter sp. JGD-13]|uniref:Molybdenum transport system permease n=2 Tax=Aurantiacibacter sediminis TaxID=2793064 RepID=A0ABS0MZ11_9SPHN|nr:molybdate ABC transporter permease subunit [Aurantiacibacter sediminis]MBH5320963.1 molybdate ABC transporter permease subunit [Aurantiacibacter sediminis]